MSSSIEYEILGEIKTLKILLKDIKAMLGEMASRGD